MLGLSPDELVALRLSLRVASVATAAAFPLAVLVAYVLARSRFPGKLLLDAVVHLPLVLPPVVTGYALLVLFGRRGAIGAFLADHLNLVLSFRWTGAALAGGVMGFPLMVRPMRQAFEAIDVGLEQAAATLGAGAARVFVTITLPLALPGLLGGMVLAFARALGEFGATITFVSSIPGETRTLPAAIYTFTQVPGGDADAARLALVSAALALGFVLLSELLARPIARMVRGV